MIFFTADDHWGHKNIIKYCNRPFASVEEMDRALIDNWNKVVGVDDDVYNLGDISMCDAARTQYIVSQLNGRIHMIWGNHDKKEIRDLLPWASSQDYAEVRIDGNLICMSHYAMRVWNGSHKGSYMFYGHSHGTLPPIRRSIDVGVDVFNYRPVTFKQIKSYLASIGSTKSLFFLRGV